MKRWNWIAAAVATVMVVLLVAGDVTAPVLAAGRSKNAFGFNSSNVHGFPTGSAEITGGGAYDMGTNFVHAAGGCRCTSDIHQGPFNGCLADEGVRWDTAALLENTPFKCSASASETLKTAHTGGHTVALVADFYRQGDGIDESFTAKMIVSDTDLAPDVAGVQNVWIQGIGCDSAVVNFN
jgi:hypothetical protein